MELKRLNAIELAIAINDCRWAGAVNASVALSQHIERLECELHEARSGDPTGDLIHANRDAILDMHKEAIRRIKALANEHGSSRDTLLDINCVIEALNTFHPMHCESWKGWPK